VRLTNDWGDFAYQLRIPLRSSGDWPGLGAVPGQEIAIGLQWSVEPPAHIGKEHAARPGGRPGMGPPPGMEDGERGPGGGRPGPGERTTSKRNVWVKTRLSKK
jgi:hypothetical protein